MSQQSHETTSKRPYIPRESRTYLPSAAYDLSAAPYMPIRLDLPISYPISSSSLPSRVAELVRQRILSTATDRERRVEANPAFSEPMAIAPNSEILMESAIAPIVKRFTDTTGNNNLYVSSSGYPLPFWLQEKLGTEIREFDFDGAIQRGEKLPEGIRTVYLDHPRTYGATRSTIELQQFIRANPDVLFIVDQANVGFAANPTDSEGTPQDLLLRSSLPDSLLITTNSTSKQIATGVAWMYASDQARGLISAQQETMIAGFDEQSLQTAFRVLDQEQAASEYRRQIVHNRHGLASLLPEESLPFGERNLAHLIIDATRLGYANAAEMVTVFRRGDEERGVLPMAIKTCEPYADSVKHPEILNQVFVAIPVNGQVLENLYRALSF